MKYLLKLVLIAVISALCGFLLARRCLASEWSPMNYSSGTCYAWTQCSGNYYVSCQVEGYPCRVRVEPFSYVICQSYSAYGYWETSASSCFSLPGGIEDENGN